MKKITASDFWFLVIVATVIVLIGTMGCNKHSYMTKKETAKDSTKVDTVATVLTITSHKVSALQQVPGYKLLRNDCVVGYLSRQKKQLPRRVQVWGSL
jgi:S-adenosylmethionine:diacylglycerol 3-amino-3-carboxypropyl transferase